MPHRSCWHRGARLPGGVPQPGPLSRGGQPWARLCTPAWGRAELLPAGWEALGTWFGRCCLRLLAQVITGGHYDVDCYVEDPNGRTIYKETKKQYDSFPHRTEVKGVYTFCFSNEFSTFSHKTVYFDFQVGDEPPILPDMSNRVTALTQVGHCTLLREESPATVPTCGQTAPQDGSWGLIPFSLCRMQKRQPPANRPATCRPHPPPSSTGREGQGGLLWV